MAILLSPILHIAILSREHQFVTITGFSPEDATEWFGWRILWFGGIPAWADGPVIATIAWQLLEWMTRMIEWALGTDCFSIA
jgi:hypothetical protein